MAAETELASKQQTLEGHKGRLGRILETLDKIKEDELRLSQEITGLANKKKEFANRQNELIMKEKTLESLMEPQEQQSFVFIGGKHSFLVVHRIQLTVLAVKVTGRRIVTLYEGLRINRYIEFNFFQ